MKNLFEFTLVFFIFVTALACAVFITNQRLRRTVLVGITMIYPLWGIIHHQQAKNLTYGIILEYLAFSGLALWTFLAFF